MFLGTGNLCGGIFSVSLSSVSASSPSLVEKYPDCGMAKRQGGPGPANGAPTNHADPLSGMWKDATHGWLENRREAARKDEQASSHKKNTAETKMQIRSGITVIVWFGNDEAPYRARLFPESFPYFMPKYHADIFTVLFSTLSSRVETWIPSDGTWEIQAPNVVRTVVSDEFLLYCTLPNGIQGERLSNCPDLDKYKRLAAGGKGSRSSGGGQKRERDGDNDDDDDIELEERARKRGPGLVYEDAAHLIKLSHSIMGIWVAFDIIWVTFDIIWATFSIIYTTSIGRPGLYLSYYVSDLVSLGQ
ncbi:hypothetical protein FIBSPDRAFT_965147 [Athelia psychrophila]|uniref:Uncharacterized protein n=1 Tax=Athelia psychrophila TaxID=1759441 RepID=A0A165WXN3_9AGAM|nr:hypothetical protein FIBSPDRAFT_965147 [Fibularhizoctonia sp. CBS 109695]